LAFFRLGLDYNNYKLSETSAVVNLDKKFHSWAVVPGVGVKWKVDKDWYATGMYEYSHGFAAKKPVADVKPTVTSHGIKIGVGYQF
jgi:opacity protein-like surface antigen